MNDDIFVREAPEKPSKTTKLINKIIVGALVVVAIALGIVFTWAFQDEQVLEVKNSPFPARTIREHPTAGGVVILDTDYCKHQEVVGRLRMSFVSTTREVFLPVTSEELHKGCKHTEVPILIPKELPPDTYKVKFRVTYDINPLKRNIPVEFESKEFKLDPLTTH